MLAISRDLRRMPAMRYRHDSLRAGLAVLVPIAFACSGPQPKTVSVQPESVKLLGAGSTATLQLTVKDEDGAIMNPQTVVWASSAPNVAKVEKGRVTAVGPGDAVITASVGKVRGKAQVSVIMPSVVEVEPAGWDGTVGQDTTFTAQVKDKAGNLIPDQLVDWSTDNERVARVTDGKVIALAAGEASIIAAYKGIKGVAKIKIKPSAPPIAKLTVSPATKALKRGAKVLLKAKAFNARGKPVSGVLFAWRSSDESVARVSADGTVTAVKKGKAKIVAQAMDKSATANIVVKK